MIRSRIAPTPSGYLHAGNAVNFAITAALTRSLGGELRLRIDDLDAERARPEYTADIFETLGWLGIACDTGPQTMDEAVSHSQQKRTQLYIHPIEQLLAAGRVYGCTCTRSDVQQRTGSFIYDGHCRSARHPVTDGLVLRFALPAAPVVVADVLRGELMIDLAAETGDPVIRRRDGLPAYHIASLTDDLEFGINLVVRGEDLLASTATQLALAQALGEPGQAYSTVRFLHHGLLAAEGGAKLSKSQGDSPLREMRQRGVESAFVYRHAAALLGLPAAANFSELTEAMRVIASRLAPA